MNANRKIEGQTREHKGRTRESEGRTHERESRTRERTWLKKYYDVIYEAKFKNRQNISPYAKHHIESFNRFIQNEFADIIKQYNPIRIENTKSTTKVRTETSFFDIKIYSPSCKQNDGTRAPIFPNECRIFDKSYLMDVYVHYSFKLWEQQSDGVEVLKIDFNSKRDNKDPILIGEIPCMVRSQYCTLWGFNEKFLEANMEDPHEFGGYFIINGKEYCIISQENKAENFIYKDIKLVGNHPEYHVWMQSKPTNRYDYPFFVTVRMTRSNLLHNPTHTNEALIYVSVSISKTNRLWIPLSIMFRAMGVVTDKEIFEYILHGNDQLLEDKLEPSLRFKVDDSKTGKPILTEKDAKIWIGKHMKAKEESDDKLISIVNYELFEKQMFSHLGGQIAMKAKIHLLAYMVRTVLALSAGIEEPNDRDNYGNKRILTAGILYGQLVKHYYHAQVSEFRKNGSKELAHYVPNKDYANAITNWLNPKSDRLMLSIIAKNISTGLFPTGGKRSQSQREGVSQLLERKSVKDTLMYLNRVITPIPKQTGGKSMGLHKLHQSHWGYIDPVDTPDSNKIGIIKHFALLSEVSSYEDPSIYYQMFMRGDFPEVKSIDALPLNELKDKVKIIINGNVAFVCDKDAINSIAKILREKRRSGINRYSSISIDYSTFTLNIRTDAGRIVRPLLIVDEGNKLRITKQIVEALAAEAITWDHLITGGSYETINQATGEKIKKHFPPVLEFIDISESANYLIAFNQQRLSEAKLEQYTHCEIDDSIIFGINSLGIPFANYNPGPRNIFQDGMSKQSVGIYVGNYEARMDKSALVMPGLERPLVCAIGDTLIPSVPAGINIRIAITPYTGYTQEDAIIANQHSVDCGMFDIYNYKLYTDTLQNQDEEFRKPQMNDTRGIKIHSSYENINDNGHPKIGAILKKDDIVIGKVVRFTKTERETGNITQAYLDKSIVYHETNPGIVERVLVTQNHEKKTVIKVKIRIFRSLIVGDKLACYDEETTVLTMRGWLKFSQLKYTDKIATFDPVKNCIHYTIPTKLHSYEYICHGKREDQFPPMIRVATQQADLLVTPNHRMWIKTSANFHIKRADCCLGKKFFLQTHAKHFTPLHEASRNTLWQDAAKLKADIATGKNFLFPEIIWQLSQEKCRLILQLLATRKFENHYIIDLAAGQTVVLDELFRLTVHACYRALSYKDIDGLHLKVYLTDDVTVPIEDYQTRVEPYVGKVYCCQVKSGLIVVKRNNKVCISGNSRAAQKGICSLLIRRANMPFTKDGIVPDILFNPHGIITRMTMGHLLEILCGTIAANKATTMDASAFNGLNVRRDIEPLLQELGLTSLGDTEMYDGLTGQKMKAKIYTGFIYYQRLKHLVNDKVYARATGPRNRKTKQPVHGRKASGALKLGTMEKDAIIAHGASGFLKEAFFDNSDHFEVFVSKKSGLIVAGNDEKQFYASPDVVRVKMPWTTVMHNYLLQSLCIAPRLELEEDDDMT